MGFIGRFLVRLLLGWILLISYILLFFYLTKDLEKEDPVELYFGVWLTVGFFLLIFSPMKYAIPLVALFKDFFDDDDGPPR